MQHPFGFGAGFLLALALALAAPATHGRSTGGLGGVPEWMAPRTSPTLREIGSALRTSRRTPADATRPLVDRILAAGPDVLEDLLDVLVAERVPESEAGDPPQILSAPQLAIVLAALERLPRADVQAALSARLAASRDGAGRAELALVRALGAVGEAKDIARAVALAPRKPHDPQAAESLTREGRVAVRATVESILARDPRAWTTIAGVLRTVDRAAALPVLEAVTARRDPRALGILADAVRTQRDLAPLCVAGAPKVGPSLDADVTADFVEWMAGELPASRPEHRRSLYRAIGVLDDGTHARLLIDGLSDEDEESRGAALWALRKLTGFGFPAEPAAWTAWLDAEVRWNERERPQHRQDLLSRDPARASAALRAYAGRRAWRASLAEDVAVVLERSEPGLRLSACQVLEGLGALSAIRPMAGLLDAPEESVREAARRALGALSGLDLPRDPHLALEALDLL